MLSRQIKAMLQLANLRRAQDLPQATAIELHEVLRVCLAAWSRWRQSGESLFRNTSLPPRSAAYTTTLS